MPIEFRCPSCGKSFEVNEGLAGKRGKCKQCGELFVIPETSTQTPIILTTAPAHRTLTSSLGLYRINGEHGSLPPHASNGTHSEDRVPLQSMTAKAYEPEPERSPVADRGFFDAVLGRLLPMAFGLVGVFCILALVWGPGLLVFVLVHWGIAFLLLMIGWVGGVIPPFRESTACGLKYLFIPFYSIYYRATRWDPTRRFFLISLSGLGILVVGSVLMGAIQAARAAALRDQLRDTNGLTAEALADPKTPTGREADAEYAKLIRASIAQATELSERLASIQDLPSAQAAAPRLKELGNIKRQLESRARQLPKPTSFGLFGLTLDYNQALNGANVLCSAQYSRVSKLASVYDAVASAYGPGLGAIETLAELSGRAGAAPQPEVAGAWPGNPPPPRKGEIMTVEVTGIRDGASEAAVERKIREIYESLSAAQPASIGGHKRNGERTFVIVPAVDTTEFASRIDFGKVTRTWEGRITVAIDGPKRPAESVAAKANTNEAEPTDAPKRADRLANGFISKAAPIQRPEPAPKRSDPPADTLAAQPAADPAPKPEISAPTTPEIRSLAGTKPETDGRVSEDPNVRRLAQPETRKEALAILKRKTPDASRLEVAKAVEPLLSDPDAQVRADAATVLGAWGVPANIPALIVALKDPESRVRQRTLDALKSFPDPTVAEAVAALLPGPDRIKVRDTLKSFGSGVEEIVLPFLEHTSPFVRADACRILKDIGTARCVPALMSIAGGKKEIDSRAAADALSNLSRRGVDVNGFGPKP